MTWSCMDPLLARMALRQTGLPEAFSLLAYVEGYALVVGSLGVRLVPTLVAREAVAAVLDGRRPWQPSARTFPAHLRAVAHEAMAERLRIEARSRAMVGGDDTLSSLRMAVAQVGDLTGVAEFAHSAAELMPHVRVGDLTLRDESVRLADDMRRRLAAIAPESDDIGPARTVADPGPFAPPPRVVTVPRERDDEPTRPRRVPMPVVRGDVDKTPRQKP